MVGAIDCIGGGSVECGIMQVEICCTGCVGIPWCLGNNVLGFMWGRCFGRFSFYLSEMKVMLTISLRTLQ